MMILRTKIEPCLYAINYKKVKGMNKILYYTGKVVDGRKNASSLIKDNYVHLTSTLGFWHFP